MKTSIKEKKRFLSMAQKENLVAHLIVVPVVLYFVLFTLIPVVMLFGYSMRDYQIVWRVDKFIGIKNFISIFTVPEYLRSLGITLVIAAGVMVVGIVFSFVLALLLNKIARMKEFFRIVWYLPALFPMAAVSVLMNTMLQPEGNINNLFVSLGLDPVIFQQSTAWMYFFIILVVSWKGIGSTALLFLAGLNGIDKEIYEAADLDGCTGFNRVFRITLPMIRPMFGFILITGLISALNIFEPVMFISGGGPNESTKVLLYRIYDEAFRNDRMGMASALSVVLFIVILILTVISMMTVDDSLLKSEFKAARKGGKHNV